MFSPFKGCMVATCCKICQINLLEKITKATRSPYKPAQNHFPLMQHSCVPPNIPPKTSYIVMTDAERSQLCRKKQDASALTQRELDAWVESKFGKKVTQGTISNTLKRSAELLAASGTSKQSRKPHKAVNYPLLKNALLSGPDVPGRSCNEPGAAQVQRSILPSTTLPRCLPTRVFQRMTGLFQKSIWHCIVWSLW